MYVCREHLYKGIRELRKEGYRTFKIEPLGTRQTYPRDCGLELCGRYARIKIDGATKYWDDDD
jgi:hypothetical protein